MCRGAGGWGSLVLLTEKNVKDSFRRRANEKSSRLMCCTEFCRRGSPIHRHDEFPPIYVCVSGVNTNRFS